MTAINPIFGIVDILDKDICRKAKIRVTLKSHTGTQQVWESFDYVLGNGTSRESAAMSR